MKRNKKKLIFGSIAGLILIIISVITYKIVADDNRLTTAEKNWITINTSNFHNVAVINNVDVIGKNGEGVLFNFLDDFSEKYSLSINPVTYNTGENPTDIGFKVKNQIKASDLVFYEEHYVLLGKNYQYLTNLATSIINVGVLSSDANLVRDYLPQANIVTYDDYSLLYSAFNTNVDIQYILVPLESNLSAILTDNYEILHHFSDIKRYYVFEQQTDDILSSIVAKYYANWKEEYLEEYRNQALLNIFLKVLNISSKDLDQMNASLVNYGFVNNSPYEAITSSNYSGIIAEYLNRFSQFSGVEYKFYKYRNNNKFSQAIDNNEIDIYFDCYNMVNDYYDVRTLLPIKFKIIMPNSSKQIINSEKSLVGQEIYVLKNSLLENYLKQIKGLKIKTYSNTKDLFKLTKKGFTIAVDSQIYNYYANQELNNYSARYEGDLNINYQFKFKKNNALTKLFSKFISIIDPEEATYAGLYNHKINAAKSNIQTTIAKYTLLVIIAGGLITMAYFRSNKKIKVAKRIRKDAKIKYIDLLTSLKNRNYLSENIDNWNNNPIYPQTALIIDLNDVQEINDHHGYEAGDRQIMAAANILIKNQLDNSEIIRTDGNEFLVYLIGYNEKQVVSYMRKLYKEFNGLPYDYGVAMGFSVIEDAKTTLEDAINEAVDNMKNNKEEIMEDNNEKD